MAKYEPRDKFYRKAREKGLPSRAAFKIEELIQRIKLPHDARVIDLGCAPGGWIAILGAAVGDRGRVIGIDLDRCRGFGPNVETIAADIRDAALPATVMERLGRRADLVTSDLSPKLTGIKDRDEAQFAETDRCGNRDGASDAQAGRRDDRKTVHGRRLQGQRRAIRKAVSQNRGDAGGRDAARIVGVVRDRARFPRLMHPCGDCLAYAPPSA